MTEPTALGTALPLPTPSAELEHRLATRRSAPAQALMAPGPTPSEIDRILEVGSRTPDHGKLFPWRFVVLGPDTRSQMATELEPLAARQGQPDKARSALAKLVNPPLSILVISAPVQPHRVPVWEQHLSAGAVCMNLSHAANALGYAASWITDWYAYDPAGRALFGIGEGEQVAGFIHIGTLAEAPLERPRPDLSQRVLHRP